MDIKIGAVVFLSLIGSVAARRAVFIEPFTNLGISATSKHEFFDLLIPNMHDRAHQALFNEVGEVLKEKDDAVCIALSNVIYKNKSASDELSTFWAPRASLLLFDDTVDETLFPAPLSPEYFKKPMSGDVLVVTMPFHDRVTKKIYSAGTRFTRSHKDTDKFYGITLYHAKHKKKVLSRVPKEHAHIEVVVSCENAQKELVKLLYSWANLSHDVVPYVWGGSSFIYTQKAGKFSVDQHARVTYNGATPATGYDCSELILRAAQICGIPYFCKVTFVIPEHLRLLRTSDDLVEGDILWNPGHVMVVGNIERNEIVESRGYNTGYGKVQVIELNKLFPEIATYDDLKKKYFNKEPFKLVRKDGSFYQNITDFRIFKLASLWGK